MSVVKSTQGYYFPIVTNDALYSSVSDTSTYLLAMRSVTGTTFDDASEKAGAYSAEMHQLMQQYGIPSAPAYFPDTGANNIYGLFNFAEELAVGSYPVTINGTTGYALTVGSGTSHTCSFTPSVSSPYLPLYAAQHDAASGGFSGYGQDRILYQVIPSAAVQTDNKLDMGDIYRVYVVCSIRCREYAGGWTAEYYIRINKDDISLSGTLLDGAQLIPDDDPLSQDGDSVTLPSGGSPYTGAGGVGTHGSEVSDAQTWPSAPSLSAIAGGLVTLYAAQSPSPMQDLGDFLWSALDLDSLKKLFVDPMDAIFGAAILPCTPVLSQSASSTIKFGNIDSGVAMPFVTQQYVTLDFGTINIREKWGAFLDYSPYTKVTIWLPYIGFKELNVDEVMNNPVGVHYIVDCLTGGCSATVGTLTSDGKLHMCGQYAGSCAMEVPLSSNNWSSMLSSAVSVASSAAGGFMMGGPAGAAVAGGLSLTNAAVSGGMKPTIERSGSVSGPAGFYAIQYPYVIVERPRQSKALNYNYFEGYPSNATFVLGNLDGFTKVESVHLTGIPALADELDEIEALLKQGVII